MNTLFKELSENHSQVGSGDELTVKGLNLYIDYHHTQCGIAKLNSLGKVSISAMAMAAILISSGTHQELLLTREERSAFNNAISAALAKLVQITTRPPIEGKLYQALRNSPEGLDDPASTAAIDAEPDVIF